MKKQPGESAIALGTRVHENFSIQGTITGRIVLNKSNMEEVDKPLTKWDACPKPFMGIDYASGKDYSVERLAFHEGELKPMEHD